MKEEPEDKGRSRFARLSGIGLQMGITIFLGAYLGKYLDSKYPSDKKWFTIGFTLLSVALALYNVLKQVNRINEEEK
jgi:F0F1-type ATP synthase assembly protein I